MMHLKQLITTTPVPGSDSWHTAVLHIDPDTAKNLLEGNYGNRKLSLGVVARFAATMRAGDWVASPEPLIFASNGRLLNGQHRLNAVIASETPQRFLCVFGVDERVFSVLDRGKVRSLADAHAMEKRLAEAARLLTVVMYPSTRGSAVQDRDFLRIANLIADTHATLMSRCQATAPFFSSAPVRAAAVLRIVSGEDAEWVLHLYRALVLVDTTVLPPVGGAALAAVAHSRWTSSGGGDAQMTNLARAWSIFQKSGADRTRAPAVDVEKGIEACRAVIRQALKDTANV